MADAANYETMSRAELTKLRADIDRAISTVADRDQRNALKAAEAAAREHGFSLSDLVPLIGGAGGTGRGKGRRVTKADAEVRFRNPDDHSQTWSGRGRRPGWYSSALAEGRPVEDLRAS